MKCTSRCLPKTAFEVPSIRMEGSTFLIDQAWILIQGASAISATEAEHVEE
jgi:hypothetical protein